jgi:hypothetical protein
MSFVYNFADIKYKTEVFNSSGIWIKPQGITMVSITAIGGGGGGGGGITNTSGSTRTGGGGGGTGAITRLIIPEMFITDSLVISVGTGGNGGVSSGGAGTDGGNTTVDMVTKGNGDIYTRIIIASGGTAGNGSTGGLGALASVIGDALYSSMGIWTAYFGFPGSNGTTTTGTLVSFGIFGNPIAGGAGGGGMSAGSTVSSTGGAVNGSTTSQIPSIAGGVGNTSLTNGGNGIISYTPFYTMGGSGGGGGGTTPISGGKGGDGAPGCGGGGGGAGTTPTGVGGTGGRGGNGLVIIQCW